MCSEGTAKTVARQVLPANVKPSHYDLSITPALETFEYSGNVTVSLAIVESTKVVVCNAKELKVSKAVISSAGASQEATSIVFDGELETVSFTFENQVEKGSKASLYIEFQGTHNDNMAGFYRSGYTDQQGSKKYLVVTQFEATDCRRCFPSWDEPNLKATFDVTLVVPKDRTALSNMPITKDESISDSLKSVSFATTPIMSTYLLAMCVGEFEYLEETAKPTVPSDAKPIVCRTYTLPGQKEMGRFGLGVCVKTLEFFSKYFDVSYPLPKMDMIAIPDFGAGAMENWGLVTYRETALLYDPAKSSARAKERVAYVVGHELAHQWFGNLVTMDWWSELWLNEGFATFVGWLAVDHIFPEWNVFTSFLIGEFNSGVGLDALRSSHPIEVEVNSATEINQIFDAISYSKGASVIRMLNSFLGGDVFAKGVTAYLKKHKYSNAKTVDLWASLAEASGKDVAKMMYSWTRDVGYPQLEIVSETYDEAKMEMTLALTQKRFLTSGDLTAEEESASPSWFIPIGIVTSDAKAEIACQLTEKKGTITFPYTKREGSFWKLNAKVTGFYRVLYSSAQLKSLGSALAKNLESFSTQDRIGIISDAFAFARAGLGSTVDALEILKAYKHEENQMVLEGIADRISSLKNAWFKDEKALKGISKLQAEIFAPKIKVLGYDYPDGEEQLTVLKRNLCISEAADSGEESVINELTLRFHKYVAGDKKAFHANLRNPVFKTVLNHSKNAEADFESVLKIYKDATAADERIAALGCLGATNDFAIVDRILNKITLDTETVKLQDCMYPVSSLARQCPQKSKVLAILWTWMITNWPLLHKNLSPSLSLLGRIVQAVVAYNIGEDFALKVEAWAKGDELSDEKAKATRAKEIKDVKRPLDQSLEALRGNTKWYEREHAAVSAWLN